MENSRGFFFEFPNTYMYHGYRGMTGKSVSFFWDNNELKKIFSSGQIPYILSNPRLFHDEYMHEIHNKTFLFSSFRDQISPPPAFR